MSDDQAHALANDVERLTEENVALRRRHAALERELNMERARHEVSSADGVRLAALRADVARSLAILEALKSKLLDGESDSW